MAPIVLLCGLLGLQALAAGTAHVYADNSAHAGALAAELGQDPEDAARKALPGWAKSRIAIKVKGQRVITRVEPRAIVPQLSRLLATTSSASFVNTGALPVVP